MLIGTVPTIRHIRSKASVTIISIICEGFLVFILIILLRTSDWGKEKEQLAVHFNFILTWQNNCSFFRFMIVQFILIG